jgi:hypothetical protein
VKYPFVFQQINYAVVTISLKAKWMSFFRQRYKSDNFAFQGNGTDTDLP